MGSKPAGWARREVECDGNIQVSLYFSVSLVAPDLSSRLSLR